MVQRISALLDQNNWSGRALFSLTRLLSIGIIGRKLLWKSLSRGGVYSTNAFSPDRFGKCILNKMDLGELKNLAKIIFKPATVRYLKSHA